MGFLRVVNGEDEEVGGQGVMGRAFPIVGPLANA
jgi:hypothetical protein